MDKLSLKKYHRQAATVDNDPKQLKKKSKPKALVNHSSLPDKGLSKTSNDFLEFFVNDNPLSELLDKFYGSRKSILENSIGVLGLPQNEKAETIKIKQLLGKSVSEKEIRQLYPASWTDNELEWYLDKYNGELSNPEILIYCCAQCGDYDCGGVTVTIDKTQDLVIWTIKEDGKFIQFRFDKYQYFDILGSRLNKLQSLR